MAKKKSKKQSQFFDPIALIFAIAAICMIFVAGVNYTGKYFGSESSFAGTEIVFGNDRGFGFSFMALLPYVLTLLGVVLLGLKAFGVANLEIFAFAAFVVAAVFFFLTASFVVISDEYLDKLIRVAGDFKLGVGSILSGVFSALAAFALVCKKLIK